MKLLNKIKTIFSNKEKRENKIHKQISQLIIARIDSMLKDENSAPKDLSIKEWRSVLKGIKLAFVEKESLVPLKSLGKRKIRQGKIQKGFNDFQKHYKEI